MEHKQPAPAPENLLKSATAITGRGPAPVHLWNPDFCGDLDMQIRRDGSWYYLGTPIGRPALVKLFSSILKLEDGKYYLVTPVEKVGITVEDAPFIAVDFQVENPGPDQVLVFTTHVDDVVRAGPDHPLRVTEAPGSDTPAPYLMVRNGLEARIDRKSFYRLVDLGEEAEHEGEAWYGVRSGGAFFPMIRAAALSA